MVLDKKQIWVISLFKLQMDRKTVQATCNINTAFGPGTANEHTVQWWFKKLCKRDGRLEDKELSGRPSEVNNDQLRGSSKQILLQLHNKLPKNSTLTILQLFGILSKLESCLMNWLQKKKKNSIIFKCCLLLFYATTLNHFLTGLGHERRSDF